MLGTLQFYTVPEQWRHVNGDTWWTYIIKARESDRLTMPFIVFVDCQKRKSEIEATSAGAAQIIKLIAANVKRQNRHSKVSSSALDQGA